MYEIRTVPIGLIDANPYRDLATYPWIKHKVEQLQRSIADVGFWAGVIGRAQGKRYQLAFGHHRVEAARRNKKPAEIPLIVAALTDKQMLQFMGRENGEDYGADFMVMLNTWDAAIKFSGGRGHQKLEGIHIARLLGWTNPVSAESEQDQMNHTARACASASALIDAGQLPRERFNGLTVRQVEDIAGAAYNRMQQMAELAKKNRASYAAVKSAQGDIAKGAARTAELAARGEIAQRNLRASVDVNAYRFSRDRKRQTPLFAAFGSTVIAQIERMLNEDATADRLAQVRAALADITENSDKQVVQRIDLALEQLGERADDWRKKLTHPAKKIVPLTPITGRGS